MALDKCAYTTGELIYSSAMRFGSEELLVVSGMNDEEITNE